MQHTLKSVVAQHDDDAEALSLVSRRGGVLEGLCAYLGVNEQTGDVVDDDESAQPRGVRIRFEGEAAAGDGLRREWFDEIVGEIVDVERGLFTSADGGRTMQPNPHSATVAGPDHLSCTLPFSAGSQAWLCTTRNRSTCGGATRLSRPCSRCPSPPTTSDRWTPSYTRAR